MDDRTVQLGRSFNTPLGQSGVRGTILALVAAACLAGCTSSSGPGFAPAFGPKIRPLPHAPFCPHPVPRALGFIYTPVQVVPVVGGNWLVADGGAFNRFGSKVVEFNSAGRPIWAYVNPNLDFVHSAYPTTRGNVLITDTNNNRVIEVSPQCKIVFNTDDLGPGHGFLGRGRFNDGKRLVYPNDAKQIPNGHYLISSRGTSTVFEIDRHGHVYWSCHSFRNLLGKPDRLSGQHNPQRLANGNTIISDSNNARVLIVDRNCTREVWQYPPIGHTRNAHGGERILWPRDATVMTNHDILIDDSLHNRCLEVNKRHVIIRKYYDLPQPYACWPMPNGVVASANSNTHGIVLWGPGVPQAQPMALIPRKPIRPPGHTPPPKHLINGGFESPAAPGNNPIGWQMDDLTAESLPPGVRAHMLIDSSVAHSGFSSALIEWERRTQHGPLFWGQTIRVRPYRWIRVSGWVMTQNVRLCKGCDLGKGTDRGNSAYLAVQLIRPSPWQNPTTVSFPKLRGTHSWTHFAQTYAIPQGTRFMVIQCVLAGAGKAWFDDVHIKTLPRRFKHGFDSGAAR